MATWPENLPGPVRTIAVQAGNNINRQQWQSGRADNRRFGAGAPDRVSVQFRVLNSDAKAFEYFFHRSANLGVNWFSAPWLSGMGYSSHVARVLGYPKRKGVSGLWSDYSATLLIQNAAYVPSDSEWPSEGPGVGAGATEGLVVGWRSTSAASSSNYPLCYLPGDLYAVKLEMASNYLISGSAYYPVLFALKANGTISAIGHPDRITAIAPGVESLTGIIDIAASYRGLYYLTAGGIIGHLGDPLAGTDYPETNGFTKIWSGISCAAAQNEDGTITVWSNGTYSNFTGTVSNPVSFFGCSGPVTPATYHYIAIVTGDGDVKFLGSSGESADNPFSVNGLATYSYAYGGGTDSYQFLHVYSESRGWEQYGYAVGAGYCDPPSGFVPKKVVAPYYNRNGVMGINSDGTLIKIAGTLYGYSTSTKIMDVASALSASEYQVFGIVEP